MVIMEAEKQFEESRWVDDLDTEDSRMTGSFAVVVVTLALIIAFLINLQINTTVTLNEALEEFEADCRQQGGQYSLSDILPSSESENPVDELLGERARHVHVCLVDGQAVATLLG